MGVLQSSPLPVLAFSRNTINCELASNDHIDQAGRQAVNALQVNGVIAIGDTILLKWNNILLELTASDVPGDSDVLIPSGDGSAGYVATLAAHLASQYLIDKDFTVASAGQQVVFTAREPGTAYMFDERTTGNLQVIQVTTGLNKVLKASFAHHLEVWVRQRAQPGFQQAYNYNVELDYPLTGISTTDIGPEILDSYLEPDLPVLAGQAITECTTSIGEYYVRYAQYFGESPTVKRLKITDTALVAKGGLSVLAATQRNILTEFKPDIYDVTQDRFLRQGSRAKLVDRAQPEWLYFLNLAGPRTITAEATIFYTDGSEFALDIATVNAVAYGKYQFPAGFEQLAIATRRPVEQVPLYYTIRLKTATGYITAEYTYVIDYTWQEFSRYFVYLNAYGAYQTLATTGTGQQGAGRTKADARISRPSTTAALKGDFLEYNIRLQDQGEVNIGYDRSDRRSTALLRDFFSSTSIFLYQDARLIPVGLNTSELKEGPDGEDLYATSFEYYYLTEEAQFTEQPGLEDNELDELLTGGGAAVPPLLPGTGDGYDDFDELIDDPEINTDEFFDDI